MLTFVCLFVCIVVHLEGSTPTKYGLLLNNDDRYKAVKRELSKYCGLVSSQLLLVEIFGASVRVKYILHNVNKHKTVRTKLLCSSCKHKNNINCSSHNIIVTLLLIAMGGPCTAGLHPAKVSIYCAGLKQYYGCLGNIVGCVTALWSIITKGLL